MVCFSGATPVSLEPSGRSILAGVSPVTHGRYFNLHNPFAAALLCLAVFTYLGLVRVTSSGNAEALNGLRSATLTRNEGRSALSSQLGALFSEWKAIPSAEMSVRLPLVKGRVDATLTKYVVGRLEESPRPAARNIEDDINKALATATWERIFGVSPAEVAAALEANASRPLAYVLEGSGQASELYAAAFAIGFGNAFSTRVHGFAPNGGGYGAVDAAGALDGAVSGMVALESFAPHQLRLLIWSLHIGSPEGLTTVAVYGFDGAKLQTIWVREDVPAARVTLQDGLVVIESHSHEFAKEGTIFPYERTYYRQVSTGLKRVKVTKWTER